MSIENEAPPYYYIAYLDEAGDPGIERVRPLDEPGGSEWLVIGGVLIEASNEQKPVEWVRSILNDIGAKNRPALHFRDLHEWQKPLVCQKLADLPVNLFVMTSNKKNMRAYRNARAAAKSNPLVSKQIFYNFCLRLILERITDCCLRHSMRVHGAPRHVKIFYSKRGGHNYAHTFIYNETLKSQARSKTTWLKRREIKWEVMDRRLQEAVMHTTNAGVQLADVVASSFFQSCDVLPPTSFNPYNARLLGNRIATEAGFFRDYGVIFQPSPELTKAQLVPKQKDIFEFYGYDRRDFDVPWFK